MVRERKKLVFKGGQEGAEEENFKGEKKGRKEYENFYENLMAFFWKLEKKSVK